MTALIRIPCEADTPPLPSAATDLVAAAAPRIEAFEFGEERVPSFVASNAHIAHDILARVRAEGAGPRFCEWGSGYGVVTGLAALIGYDATGIEIEGRLVRESRELLRQQGIEARIVEGSYLAPGIREGEPDAAALEKDLGFAPWDFDVVYAYPWPAEAATVTGQFERFAPPGAQLVTFHGGKDLLVFRQEA